MNDKYKDSIYEELKGFFPKEYDLTPEELENIPDKNTSQLGDVEVAEEVKISLSEKDSTEAYSLDQTIKELALAAAAHSPVSEGSELTEDDNDFEEEEEKIKVKAPASKKLIDLFDIVEMFAVCVACIIVVFSFFARLTVVDGDSMNDTLIDGEFLVISDFMYTPEQGDIIVLQDTAAGHTELQKPLIKRVIAVGGQSVKITRDGVVTVTDKDGNSSVIDNSYTKQEPYEGRYYGEWDIPEGYIFVMGDNRNHSTDSRDFRLGVVDERCVVGEAKLRLLPFDKISLIENPFK